MIFQNFDVVFSGLAAELSSLLGARFRPGEPHADTPIGESLAAIVRFHQRGDADHRDWNILRLGLLEKQLRSIADKRPDLFRGFRERLLSEDAAHYPGTRFEVLMAALLTEVGLDFSHPEPPDFLVTTAGGPVPVECTSVVYRGADPSRLRARLSRALHRKARRAGRYAGAYGGLNNVVVAVDATNLFHGSDQRGRILMPDELIAYVGERLDRVGLGAVLVFTLVLDRENDTLAGGHLRADARHLAAAAKEFLDEWFPVNRARRVTDYLFPPLA